MNKITKNIAALIAFGTTTIGFAQVTQQKIGTNPTIIDPNAALEIQSATKGLLMPRLALTATNNFAPLTAHVVGMTVYNTGISDVLVPDANKVTPGYYYNDGSQWVRIATGADAKTEPWRQQNTTNEATANNQNIYQTGSVAVGDFSGAVSTKKMEIKGDFKSEVTDGAVVYGAEVNSSLQPQSAGNYWINTAIGQAHSIGTTSTGAAMLATNGTVTSQVSSNLNGSGISINNPTVASAINATLTQATMQSHTQDLNTWSTVRTVNTGNFYMETYNVPQNYGSSIALENNGLFFAHSETNGQGDHLALRNRSEVMVRKGEGVRFNFRNAAGTGISEYWFPITSGTNGQVMTQTTTGKMIWSNPASLSLANNGLNKNGTTNEIELGGTLNKTTTIATVNGGTTHPLNITGLPTTGATTDVVIVSSTGGQLKTISTANLIQEPWQVQGGTTKATTNAQNIYQTGSVAIGANTIPNVMSGATVLSTPKFHVAGDVSITGKYYTTNSVYADYVFEKYFKGSSDINPNYEFKSLNYVKDFIKTNHHLPGVESIADLAKAENGYTFDMTKLTVQSLEKIEELYLHTIEQQDKIDAQQTEIEQLRKQAKDTNERLVKLERLLKK